MGMIDELKKDATDNVVDAILEDKKTQEMLKVANPFIKPALKSLLKELGPDDKRMMLFLDNDTGLLCFMTIKTANIKAFEIEGVTKEDIFTIDPEEIKKGNVTEVVKAIIKKVGIKFM